MDSDRDPGGVVQRVRREGVCAYAPRRVVRGIRAANPSIRRGRGGQTQDTVHDRQEPRGNTLSVQRAIYIAMGDQALHRTDARLGRDVDSLTPYTLLT